MNASRKNSSKILKGTNRADKYVVDEDYEQAILRKGHDTLESSGFISEVCAGRGSDTIYLEQGANYVALGRGNDQLYLGEMGGHVLGGRGKDSLKLDLALADIDINIYEGWCELVERSTGKTTKVRNVETFELADKTYSIKELKALFNTDDGMPVMRVANGTQALSVNDTDPTLSVVWDRAVQQAVIEATGPNGPTIASRAYAMVHTAIYDAYASYSKKSMRVSIDVEGDNLSFEDLKNASESEIAKAANYAAFTVLSALYPDQAEYFTKLMRERFGLDTEDDGSVAARVGIDAGEDILALRANDGSNAANGFEGDYHPVNSNPSDIKDITRWTPEYVPIDPEDGSDGQALQTFLTPHWGGVTGFASNLGDAADGSSGHLPPAPEEFFTDAQKGSTLNFASKTITLGADLVLDGVSYEKGDIIQVSKALIGKVINPGFITQAEEVVNYSANLTDKEKIIAEFWEDGGGTAFPPGTFMGFGHFVSARDNHSMAEDIEMFLALSNAVMDAGIATWEAKTHYDYVRPVRAIRDLGELGLIGEWGEDYKGEEGFIVTAWAGIDPETGLGLGTQRIRAEDFVTFQLPGGNPSPPFAEYTSGHSAFSAAGAEILKRITGSDAFGGAVKFAPGSTLFESGVPKKSLELNWSTFSDAADEAGLSRLYGGIHFNDGDIHGRSLGRDVASEVYEMAQAFINGTASDADRPFADDFFFA